MSLLVSDVSDLRLILDSFSGLMQRHMSCILRWCIGATSCPIHRELTSELEIP